MGSTQLHQKLVLIIFQAPLGPRHAKHGACHTCVLSSRAFKHTNVRARTSDCQLTFNTHRGCVYVGRPRLLRKPRKGCPTVVSTGPAHVLSDATLRNRIEAPRSRVAVPLCVRVRVRVCRSPCRRAASSVSFPPSSLRRLRHWWLPPALETRS